jgi:hypothetical protein
MEKKFNMYEMRKKYKKSASQQVDDGSNLVRQRKQTQDHLNQSPNIDSDSETHSNPDRRESLDGELSPDVLWQSPTKRMSNFKIVREKVQNWNNYVSYFLSYRVKDYDRLMNSYLKLGSDIMQCMDLKAHNEVFDALRESKPKSSTFNPIYAKTDNEITDLQMECCDRMPQTDRPHFPISNLVEIIPRLLFNNNSLKVESSVSIKDEIVSTSAYLTSLGEYAYITGLIFYEDLSLVYEGHQDMRYLRQKRKERQMEEEKLNKVKGGAEVRGDTESTKDNTFTSAYMMGARKKDDSLTSVDESEEPIHTVSSRLEEIKENDDDDNSEEEKGDLLDVQMAEKSESTPYQLTLDKDDSLKHIKMYRTSLK